MKNRPSKTRRNRRGTQGDFFANGSEFRPLKTFGGSHAKGNPRTARPFSAKRAIHLVMKSKYAFGDRSMLRKSNRQAIENCVTEQAKNTGITIRRFVNVGNHLHFVLQADSRFALSRFVRAISGIIARIVLNAEKGRPKIEGLGAQTLSSGRPQFWDARPFSRIVEWGRDYFRLTRYTLKNRLEAVGFSSATARYYADLLDAGIMPRGSG